MGYLLPDKMDKNHDGHCPACKKELGEDDELDWRVLDKDYNKFTIGEWHYFISGHMLSDIKWLTIFTLLLIFGRLVIA